MPEPGSRPGFAASEQSLHEEAARSVGHDDFGDPGYLEGLRIVLRAYDEEARMHELGRTLVHNQLVHILEQRLKTETAWKEAGGAFGHKIERPIFITGCVRTGSTALHYLMSQDPGMQNLQWWLASHPQPRPPRETWEDHADFEAAQAEMDAMFEADPSIKAMHFTTAAGPEECRHFLAQSFTDDCFEVQTTVPSYEQWYHNNSHEETYRRHRKLVQLVGSTDNDRRWLLKYPVHLRHLDALFSVYPDACIVHTHRDPREVIPSYVNMVATYRALMEDDVDRSDIAQTQLEGWSQAANRSVDVRRSHDPSQFFDLAYEDFTADPVGAVKRIYKHFDQPLSEQGEACLVQFNEQNPRDKHGKHEYSAKGTGLGEGEIIDAFGPYMDYFGMKA